MKEETMYKLRFENFFRIALKITSSLDIGYILEMIRDETRVTIPHAREACLLMFDPEAIHYTRPLHCSMYKDRINCQLCKRGRDTIQGAINEPLTFQCAFSSEGDESIQSNQAGKAICEIALPISAGKQPLAVLSVIAKDGHSFDEKT